MAKGKKGGKGKRRGDDDDESDDNDSINNDKAATTSSPNPNSNKNLSFAERRQLQRQQAAEKRRTKMKCHLCGQEGHVRRECPGLEDDGQGESKYKNAKGDVGSQMNTKSGGSKDKHKRNNKPVAEGAVSGMELPPGFDREDCSEETGEAADDNDAAAPLPPLVYYDASCDLGAMIDYLRAGRSKAKKSSLQEALEEYKHLLLDQRDQPVVKFGGCLSRAVLKPNRPWLRSTTEEQISEFHPVFYIVGLSPDFFTAAKQEDSEEAAAQALVETIVSSQEIVGLFADLDYTPSSLRRLDRNAQCQRLRATLAAAHDKANNITIQIRVSPGAPTEKHSHQDNNNGDSEHPYELAMMDLKLILKDFLPQHLNIKVHLSCWNGTPADMNELLQDHPDQIFIGMDATVTFSKASMAHECAFDVPPTKLILETGQPELIPSAITKSQGREAFGHAVYSIPWIAHGVAQHNCTLVGYRRVDAQAIARTATVNTLHLYPGILLEKA